MDNADPLDLERFVKAQDGVLETALSELGRGCKQSHWMWFVFPQLRGLGSSVKAHTYGISSIAEARAYLSHTLLGPRLIRCTETVLAIDGRSLQAIFGSPDDRKFCSCMTLFSQTAGTGESIFRQALDRFCEGKLDGQTLALLR